MNLRLALTPLALLATLAMWPQAYSQAQTSPSPILTTTPAPAATSSTREFRSAFEGYQPYTEEKIISWKDANDTTGGVGGWRAYAKEAQQGASPEAASQPDPHAGHGKPSQAKP